MNLNSQATGGRPPNLSRASAETARLTRQPRAASPVAVFLVLAFMLAYGFCWGVSWAKAEAMQEAYEQGDDFPSASG